MSIVAYRAHARNEIRTYAQKISTRSITTTPLAAIIAPGPPGIGKTTASLELLADNGEGRLVSPSHEQAKERRAETRKLLVSTNRAHITPRHIVGLGRKCLYLPEDKWAAFGWGFGTVACDQCPSKQQCPGIRQHWQQTDIYLGVHSMANWSKPGVLIIDEMPSPVDTRLFGSTELARIGANIWHPILEGWRRGFEAQWNRVLNCIEDYVTQCVSPKIWGTTVTLRDLFPAGSPQRADLDFLCDYFEANPVPAPPSNSVRSGSITPEKWIAGDIDRLVRVLRWESDGVEIAVRADMGLALTMCARVYGDNKGRFVDYRLEFRERWTPPTTSHMILDSTAPLSQEVYSRLYPNHVIEKSFNAVPLPAAHIELEHFDSYGFARSRSLTAAKTLLKPGINARVRAIRKLVYKVRQIRTNRYQKVKVGIIDHKALLESIGFDFHNEAVLTNGNNQRQRPAPDKLLQDAWAELESVADLVIGYHGGVTGSNLFNNVRILAVIGDPTGHIGMLAEEARTLDMDAVTYFRWAVSVNATQEIFRARLLDASPGNLKTVMYFGRHAPDLANMGASWNKGTWAEGGRILSAAAHAFEAAVWEQTGATKNPILGVLMPEFAGMHTTLIGSALYALRVSGEEWDATSPKTRECYRRAASSVARSLGFHTYHVPNPLGGRKPIPVHAASQAEAFAAFDEIKDFLLSTPSWRVKDYDDLALRAEEQREDDNVLAQEVEAVRAGVAQVRADYHENLDKESLKHQAACAALSVDDVQSAAQLAALDADFEQTRIDMRRDYRQNLKKHLTVWRGLKKRYKAVESLLVQPKDVLKFAYKGIVL